MNRVCILAVIYGDWLLTDANNANALVQQLSCLKTAEGAETAAFKQIVSHLHDEAHQRRTVDL